MFQIDRQLQTYLQRVEAVLGKAGRSVEGQKLKQDGDSFRQKLNTQQLFDDWKKKVEARQLVVQGRIFNIGASDEDGNHSQTVSQLYTRDHHTSQRGV